ncbi:MAG: hypothetical protein OXE78_04165 [Gammaproteobacteria bacterium]|nr:hypothetical protein [Gammaproteobacteria bacterium]
MSSQVFPKPAPAPPLPMEDWLANTDRSEVGREAFFRGRDHEYGVFQNAVTRLRNGCVGGGTMIFQGAPGAGKTAFKLECMEAVRLHSTPDEPWVAVSVKPNALNSAPSVIIAMMEAAKRELDRLDRAFSADGSNRTQKLKEAGEYILSGLRQLDVTVNVGVAGITRHGESGSTQLQQGLSAERMFSDAATYFENMRLVIFVDEAQNTPVSESAKAVMDCLHGGTQGLSLIATFFGLSDTEQVLSMCGLTRLARGRVITLDTLSYEEATSAVQGVFGAYEFNVQGQAEWVDELARLSQGWPQHINSVAVAAGQIIQKHGSNLQPNLLQQAIELGEEMKEEYFYSRLKACSAHPWIYKQLAIEAKNKDGVLSMFDVEDLTQTIRERKGQSTDDFVTNALHAGVLMEVQNRPKDFKIPIPSFSDYLRKLSLETPTGMNH